MMIENIATITARKMMLFSKALLLLSITDIETARPRCDYEFA
jgi:hypothetical protein